MENIENNDFEDMAFRLELSYSEIENILNMKYIVASTVGYFLDPSVYEIRGISFISKSLLPKDVKVNITNDDIRLKSNSTNNTMIKFTKSCFSTQYWDLLNPIQVLWTILRVSFKYY